MSKRRRYNTLIVGAGRIGCGYDTPHSSRILTHAHAYRAHGRTRLTAIVDVDLKRARAAARTWSCKAYADLQDALNEERPEIVSVCTPDDTHGRVLQQIAAAAHRPRLVICEKPLTLKPTETATLLTLYRKKRIALLVNHTRRFDPTVVQVAADLKRGRYGKVLFGWATYSNGILHSGSHIMDLVRLFFGEPRMSRSLFARRDRPRTTDRTIGAFLALERCPQFHLMAGDGSRYDYFQFDIVCERGRISFFDLGFRYAVQLVAPDPVYPGYRALGKPVIRDTQFDVAMKELVDNAVQFLDGKSALRCDGQDAYQTQRLCWKLLHDDLV